MGIFERGFRAAVSQQPPGGQDGLAVHDGDAGVSMSKIVKPDITNVRFLPDPPPEGLEDQHGQGTLFLRRRENPLAVPRKPVQNSASGRGQPNGPGTALGIA